MNLPPPQPPPPPPPPPTITVIPQTHQECSNCGSPNKWVLHHVRLRGIHRRLCTSCVLRLHPSSFCPSCFLFYESNPPHPSKRLSCSNCSSFTHLHCAPTTTTTSTPTPFLCPPCADPTFSFFDINRDNRLIDRKSSVVLLCAATIAAGSMAKAVIVARAEAERRVREAAVARKRAREALEHMLFVESIVKEKVRKIEDNHDHDHDHDHNHNNSVSEVSGSGVVGGEREKEKEKEKEKEIFEGFDGFMEKNKEVERDGQKNVAVNGTVNEKEKENNDNVDVKHLQNSHGNEEDISSTK